MNTIEYPVTESWAQLLQRPLFDNTGLQKSVKKIIDKVKTGGDKAVKKFTKEFDAISIRNLLINEKEMKEAAGLLSEELKTAILTAKKNIETFHTAQLSNTVVIETMPGVNCWRKSVAIEKVGLYIPGGTAPLFSTVLMLAIPAQLAGCKQIVLCTPPQQDGKIHPAVLFAAQVAGVNTIIKAGGVQAIAAMAYGTESVPKVYKIFGPGNQYVTCAKQIIQAEGIAIDMPAGPSEVCVLADETANAAFVAADLLSQAEHGADSQSVLISTSATLIKEVANEVEKQLALLPRKDIAAKALVHSKLILVKDIKEAIAMANEYAAEHLIISCADENQVAEQIFNAGSVFLGNYSPESAGDYASGTNHTLPTNGYARSYSGVSIDSFVKKITYQQLSKQGLKNIGPTVIAMAKAEGLDAHANAVSIRL